MNIQRTILGCILSDYTIHDLVFPLLRSDYFTGKERELFDLFLDIRPNKVDQITVAELAYRKKIDWTTVDIAQLQDGVASSVNVLSYVQLLKDEYIRRILDRDFDIKCTDEPTKHLKDLALKIETLQGDSVISQPEGIVEICEQALNEIDNEGKSGFMGIRFPLGKFNGDTNGLRKGELVVLAGRPGHGKTAMALAVSKINCMDLKRVAFFTMEMRSVELVKRLIRSYKDKENGAGEISAYDLHIFDRGGIDVGFIKSSVRMLNRVDLIVIDYLQLMKVNSRVKRYEGIGEITRELKAFALEMNVPIILLSQLNRSVEERSTWRHRLSDLRESGDIEQDADKVIFIITPKKLGLETITVNGTDHETDGITILQKEKDRNGEAPAYYLGYHSDNFMEFYDDREPF